VFFFGGGGVSVNLPPSTEEVIWAVPKDDLLEDGIKMVCRGLVFTRLGACARGRHMEEISRLEHELFEASSSMKKVVDANTAYEKKLCDQAAVQELDVARIAELERLEADRAAENARMKNDVQKLQTAIERGC